jgi:hypothetical protein
MTIRQAIKLNDLMKESRRLLKIAKRQSALIESLERQWPGITKIKRDAEGDIIIDDEIGNGECDALIEEIDTMVKKCEAFFVERP